ncbi:MAG: bifunctional nicotinamidase/pyrazinamidase [Acidobacteria bacterium]|nr:MAG: bifunctional nicotinamidase/pyrazinamidase [Acidobacteriota bacterium]PYQ26231.1 MAG: bifunctional nicotinamidase/pyrazinamidase [Acidobacteriota bacterium]
MAERVELQASDTLLAIDVQNDFCPGGALAVPRGDEVVPVMNRLARRFRHVALTQDWHPRGHVSFASSHPGRAPYERIQVAYGEQVLWPDHCVPGTPGAELHPGLDTLAADLIVRKGNDPRIDSYSAFYENDHRTSTGLAGYLRERGGRRLFLAGLATDFCVQYSALDARREGFDVFVVEDGVRGIDLDGSLAAAWTRMAAAGVRRVRERDLEGHGKESR